MIKTRWFIYELDQGRLKEIITPKGIYTNTGDANFALTFKFGAAAKFEDGLCAAVKRGNCQGVEQGNVPGSAPIGYSKTPENEGRRCGNALPRPAAVVSAR